MFRRRFLSFTYRKSYFGTFTVCGSIYSLHGASNRESRARGDAVGDFAAISAYMCSEQRQKMWGDGLGLSCGALLTNAGIATVFDIEHYFS